MGSAAAAASPLAAHAQPAMPVVGFVTSSSRERAVTFVAAFHQGLRETGYVEGENAVIELRYADGQFERLPKLVAELIQRRVRVIAGGSRVGEVAKSATTTIPVVFLTGGDAVKTGLVASLNKPGGNLTGVTMLAPELVAKRVGLLHQLVPRADAIGVLSDPNVAEAEFALQEAQAAGRKLNLRMTAVRAGREQDVESAFATLEREKVGALIVNPSILFNNIRSRLIALAARHKLPAMYELREFTERGGLINYAPSLDDAFRNVGRYAGRILKGAAPADLPVLQPTKFELVINLTTAKALGLDVPPTLLAIADAVIE
jgi:putative ABC transport system substrate-binding protein